MSTISIQSRARQQAIFGCCFCLVGQLFKLRTRFHRVQPAASRPFAGRIVQPGTSNLCRELPMSGH